MTGRDVVNNDGINRFSLDIYSETVVLHPVNQACEYVATLEG